MLTAVIFLLALASCGGNDSFTSNTTPTPVSPDFSAAGLEIEDFDVDNIALLIGDESGILYSYEKGEMRQDLVLSVASATKMITGLTIWSIIESGELLLNDNPQDYLSFWTSDPLDERSQITVEQLLGFTSGFNNSPLFPGCIANPDYELAECVEDIYDDGVGSVPGEAYYYGPEHMQVAALVAEAATGSKFQTLMSERVFDPVGITTEIGFPEEFGDNPRYSSGLKISAAEYAKILTAVLSGNLVSDRTGYLEDRSAMVEFVSRPAAIENNNLDWHYGFGFWKECDENPYTPACDATPIISSPGAFGFTPWIDIENGYWGIIAMEEDVTFLFSPSAESAKLAQRLQPLILAALANAAD